MNDAETYLALGEGKITPNQFLRIKALEAAAGSSQSRHDTSDVIGRANAFYRWLKEGSINR